MSLFEALEIKVYYSHKKLSGICPVHHGRNPTSFNYWLLGAPGIWKCYSEKCHEKWGISSLSLVTAVFKERGRREDPLDWCLNLVGKKIEDLVISEEEEDKISFSNYFVNPAKKTWLIDSSVVEKSLTIPAEYYKNKFSLSTLKTFQVGDCKSPGKEMTGRAVIPVYDNEGKYLLGCTGRAYEGLPKWRHSNSLNSSCALFNYHRAKEHVVKTGEIILVEGPTDVMKLHELGIYNCCAIFGSEIHDGQSIILESSGATTIKLMLDMDQAGRRGVELASELSRSFNIFDGQYEAKDPGELKKFEVKWNKL